jgi:hypothetical protein
LQHVLPEISFAHPQTFFVEAALARRVEALQKFDSFAPRHLMLSREYDSNRPSQVALLEAFLFIPRDIDLSFGTPMTGEALSVVEEGEHDADTLTAGQLLLYDVIPDAWMIFPHGVQQEFLLVIRFVIRIAGLFAGRADLAQLQPRVLRKAFSHLRPKGGGNEPFKPDPLLVDLGLHVMDSLLHEKG